MDCPACSGPLIAVERHRIEVDFCVGCRGIWFDAGELKLISRALSVSAPADFMSLPPCPSQENHRRCPRCRGKMDKVLLGPGEGVVVDRCPNADGLWFDAGELGRTVSLPAGAGAVETYLGESFAALKGG